MSNQKKWRGLTVSELLRQVRRYARGESLGGNYSARLYMTDGEMICQSCAKENYQQISRATRNDVSDSWNAFGIDVYWKGPDRLCAHCAVVIESEYGNPK